ncbi:MAG: hypothetical protein EXR64_04685 [Dehalococcoidia bacterium]|nr:hypothetical protein [Dehalococcoidia bacterium]
MPDPAPRDEPKPAAAPRPLPAGAMVSPLVPGLSVLDVAGMIGAACDPNDPDACEVRRLPRRADAAR